MTPNQLSASDSQRETRAPQRSEQVAGPPRRGFTLRVAVRRLATTAVGLLLALALLCTALRLWMQHAAAASLPQIDGTLTVSGIASPVTVLRDDHGTPSLRATSLDDLIVAQGYVTAQDRLFQMDTLRRHAAGELAEVLGPALVEHDEVQRVLQLRAAADRALPLLPADQRHWLELYARGVNASIDAQRVHLPLEFRLLGYAPLPWTPRDSLLVGLVMYQDLSTSFPQKLDREALTARLDPTLPAEVREQLLEDLYPVGSWRDHPPTEPNPDLTRPVDTIPEIPLDDSQVRLRRYSTPGTTASVADLAQLHQALSPASCPECRAGSNNWVVAGARTATGAPLLSNDMHLTLGVPGLWYAIDLATSATGQAEPFHVAGVSLPGTPFVIVGHNAHVAWGFTNLGADVQDLYVEHLRGLNATAEFQSADGAWHPVQHQHETIRVRGGRDLTVDVLATLHGGDSTPIISSLLHTETRPISLRWTIYDPANVSVPFQGVNAARSGAELVTAFAGFGGPSQNLIYADDAGHIGYQAIGRIPVRGSLASPTPLNAVPVDALAADAGAHEWAGYIPYDELPQITDPAGGLLATANARITPDGYRYPITLNWADPYRNERIWKLLGGRTQLNAADMIATQTDVASEPDRLIAQRLAYAIDHSTDPSKRLRQAADLLRAWDGRVSVESSAAAITDAARAALWPMLLVPKLTPGNVQASSARALGSGTPAEPWQLYTWGERAFAEEQLILHAPARWLPRAYANWNQLLTAAVGRGLADANAPTNLTKWRYGKAHPVELEHPLFAQVRLLPLLFGEPTGTGAQPQSGDGTTIKQVGHSFGPSERFTADLRDPDRSTLNLVTGEAGDPASPWFLDQFQSWLRGSTYAAPFTDAAVRAASHHTLTLEPAR